MTMGKVAKGKVAKTLLWLIHDNEVIKAPAIETPGVEGMGLGRWWFPDYQINAREGADCFRTERYAKAVLRTRLLTALKKLR